MNNPFQRLVFLLFVPGALAAQETASKAPPPLVLAHGTVIDATGAPGLSFRSRAAGDADWRKASPEEAAHAWHNYVGYGGSFTVHPDAGVVIHHVEGAWFPNWMGHNQVHSVNPAASSRRFTSRQGCGLSRANLHLDGSNQRRAGSTRRPEIKLQRFLQI